MRCGSGFGEKYVRDDVIAREHARYAIPAPAIHCSGRGGGRRASAALLDLRAGLPHHLAPRLDLRRNMRAKALGRAADWINALVGELLLHVGLAKNLVEFRVELREY